jgi:hypothetical protein
MEIKKSATRALRRAIAAIKRPEPSKFYRNTNIHGISNLAIYSTFCGSVDELTFRRCSYSLYPSYFLSNNTKVLSIVKKWGWNPIYLDNIEVNSDQVVSAFQSKIAKAMPQDIEVLSSYDYLLYVDDKIILDEGKIETSIDDLKNSFGSISLKRHPFLNGNVLHEVMEAMLQGRYRSQRELIVNYVTNRLGSGYRLTGDMYATGIILRDMKHQDTISIGKSWIESIQQCGIECQISFFFIAQDFDSIRFLSDNIA